MDVTDTTKPALQSAGRVLIVDDDEAVCRGYQKLLRRSGFETDVAYNGSMALTELDVKRFDVVLSDVGMPSLSGLQLLRAVRDRDLDLPVVLMTGAPGLDDAVQAVEHGAFRYLVKPIAPATLKEAIERAAAVHRVARLRRQAEVAGTNVLSPGDRGSLEARFEKAMVTLWMAFQPIVLPAERRVYAYEALVRNDEPTLLSPLDLFDAAECLGRVHELGRTIRRKIAEASGSAPLEVLLFANVHSTELTDNDLLSEGAPLSAVAHRIVLEITERSTLDRVSGLPGRLASLRKLGYRIAVDDLGAGYAGLSSFAQLEPDFVKLDIALIHGVDQEPRKRSVVRGMAQLCTRDLGIRVVCEGVETAAERDTLAEDGLDLFQGYLFARPARGFPAPAW
jgi:EAL domain-containing protein (putative c-di-GMP-specific phosphodiesterase class I)